MGMEHGFEAISDLLPDTLLNREPLRKYPHQASELGYAKDLFMGDITYISAAEEGEGVMLTKGEEINRAFNDLA
jgi:hypothetical protein